MNIKIFHDLDRSIDDFSLLNHWAAVLEWFQRQEREQTPTPLTARQVLERNYLFGITEIKGCRVDDKGCLHYPGDPVIKPRMRMSWEDELVYLYDSGIVAITDFTGSLFVTRVD